jgi:hypothetical protein
MLNGDILDTAYCENDGELKGTLLDIRFCALDNVSVINHEVRDEGQHKCKIAFLVQMTMTVTRSSLFSLTSRNKNIYHSH